MVLAVRSMAEGLCTCERIVFSCKMAGPIRKDLTLHSRAKFENRQEERKQITFYWAIKFQHSGHYVQKAARSSKNMQIKNCCIYVKKRQKKGKVMSCMYHINVEEQSVFFLNSQILSGRSRITWKEISMGASIERTYNIWNKQIKFYSVWYCLMGK